MSDEITRKELDGRLAKLSRRLEAAIQAREAQVARQLASRHAPNPQVPQSKSKEDIELESERNAMCWVLGIIVTLVSLINFGVNAPWVIATASAAFVVFGLLSHAMLMAMARSAEQSSAGQATSWLFPVAPPVEASIGGHRSYTAAYFRFEARVALYGAAALALAIAFDALPHGSKS